MLPGLAAGFVLPALVYLLVRPHVGGDAAALAIGGGVPAAWTLARLAWRRRLNPIGTVGVAAFAVASLITIASGGGSLALEVHDAVLTGVAGLMFLLSWRPLLLGREPAGASRTAMMVATAVVGLTLLVHAAVHVALALTLPAAPFVVLARVVGWARVAAGVLVLLLTRRLPAAP